MRSAWTAAFLLLLVPPAFAGTIDDPEMTDTGDDTPFAALDIQKAWIAANATHTQISIAVKELPAIPQGASFGLCADPGCAGVSLSYRAEFVVRDASGEPASTIPDYAGTYLVYRHGAPDGLRAVIGYTKEGVTGAIFNGTVEVTLAGNAITFHVPRARGEMVVPVGDRPGAYSITDLVAYDSPQVCDSGFPEQVPVCTSAYAIPPNPTDPQSVQWDHAPDQGTSRPFEFEAPELVPEPTPTTTPPVSTSPSTSAPTTQPGTVGPDGSTTPVAGTSGSGSASDSSSSTENKGSPSPVWLVIAGVAVALVVRKRAP